MSAVTTLEAVDITRSFGGVHALRGASVRVSSNEVLCLLGENGAGKSTLARIMGGGDQPTSGEVRIDGSPVRLDSPNAAHAIGIRTVPQELTLVRDMSVADNVLLGQLPARRPLTRRAVGALARERLNRLALGHIDVEQPVHRLSVSDRAFVQIARALTPGTRFLIADEPTAPMSADAAEVLLALLASITGQGIGVVFVSHRLDELFRIGSRVAVLRDGRVAVEDALANLGRDDLVSAMIGRPLGELSAPASEGDPGGESMLDVRGLSSGALRDMEFCVRAGQVLGVYGGTGSGREQLGPALLGVGRRDAGEVIVAGRRVPRRSPRAAIDRGLAVVPAERREQGLLLDRSIRENLTLAGLRRFSRFGFLRRGEEVRATQRWRDRLSIKSASTEVPIGSLSGGNQQKVLLARLLELQQPVLVLDEPTRGVDVQTKHDIYEILREVAADGVAVLVISSDAEELSLVSDEVLVLKDGLLVRRLVAPSQDQILHAASASLDHVGEQESGARP